MQLNKRMYLTLSLVGSGLPIQGAEPFSTPSLADLLSQYRAMCIQAEERGLDGVLFLPSPTMFGALHLDTSALVGSLIPVTSSIGLGASVDIAHTEPFHTARALAVLDNFSSGRAACVLDLTPPVIPDALYRHRSVVAGEAHYQRAEEYIVVLKGLWDSWEDDAVVYDKKTGIFAVDMKVHPLNHKGEFFSVRGPLNVVRPRQGHPILIIEDASEPGRDLAARFADIVMLNCHSREEVLEVVSDLTRRLERHGRSRDSVRVILNLALSSEPFNDKRVSGSICVRKDTPGQCADLMNSWFSEGLCDGFNLMSVEICEDARTFLTEVLPLLAHHEVAKENSTFREQLDLPWPSNSFVRGAA